jgi:(1->4)-alpha-D-glucan 1-alpha-D-glucosylmutase
LAIARARDARPDLDGELFDLLREILLGELPLAEARELTVRVQQLSGPVVAKGDEDSAHYAWGPLLCANEVGGDPDRPARSPAEFHAAMQRRAERAAGAMVTTATHDTKRSEDVRARLAALSEVPNHWIQAVRRWWDDSAAWRDDAVDPAIGWFVFQTLVGAHPLPLDRALDYVRKAMREAKEHTSWTAIDEGYESAVEGFVTMLMKDFEIAPSIDDLAADVDLAGKVNSLAQMTLRTTVPGFPDTYQGTKGQSSGTTASSTPTTAGRSTSHFDVNCSTELAKRRAQRRGGKSRTPAFRSSCCSIGSSISGNDALTCSPWGPHTSRSA